jgi:hypothetical protein
MKTKNRVISFLLAACMMLSLCAALPFVASAEVVSTSGWDGKTATQPEGSGTKDDPYLIADAANLLWLQKQIPAADIVNDSHADVVAGKYTAKFAGMYFLQTQDIDLNGKNFASIGYYYSNATRMAAFGGTYDGQGFAIRNGKITSQNNRHVLHNYREATEGEIENKKITMYKVGDKTYVYTGPNMNWGHGLFGMICGATIKNIVLDNVEVEGHGITGAIVGRAIGPKADNANAEFNRIENCVVNSNCSVNGKYPTSVIFQPKNEYDLASRLGGIVGMAYRTTVRYCVNNAPINVPGNWAMTGGIVGSAGYHTIVEYCVNAGKITYDLSSIKNDSENAVGGIVGFISPYSVGVVDKTLVGNTVIRNCYNSGIFYFNMGENVAGNAIYWGGILGGANSLSKATNKIENCYNLHALRKGENGIAANIAVDNHNYRFGGLLGSYWIGGGADVGVLEVLNSASVDIDENAYEGTNQCRYWKRNNKEGKLCVEESTSGQKTVEELAPLTKAIDDAISAFNATATAKKVGKVAFQCSTGENTNAVRFSAQIVGNGYERVGFKVWASYTEGDTVKVSEVRDVVLYTYYTALKADGEDVTPDAGNYFIAFVIDSIPTDKGNVTFTLTPYVVAEGGTSFGNTVSVTFDAAGNEVK